VAIAKIAGTVLAATAGGLLCYKLRLPAGALIGSMLAVALYNVISDEAVIPYGVRVGVQILAGAFIGMRINRQNLLSLKTMILPVAIMVVSMLAINLIVGFVLYKLTRLDLATCLFGAAPAGIVEMTLAGEAVGADPAKVALMQLGRLFSVISFMPFILKAAMNLLSRPPGG